MKRSRKALVLIAALGLTGSIAMWLGIKVGRPIYYSDGDLATAAADLRGAGMLRWSVPQDEAEVPGPVRGRVTELPDGRWLYGLARSAQVTDLVVYDPRHPADPVQPVLELNSPGHDLAPVLGPGGRLYFASDRPGGPGGFDIYTATYRDGLFFAPRVLAEGINSGLDETDPAADPGGGQLVFVRRDPEVEGGRNGVLIMASLATPDAAQPVFPAKRASVYHRDLPPPIDRDPVIAPDGVGLFFVRQEFGGPPTLMRTSWHVDHYLDPLPVRALQAGGPYRGPAFVGSGLAMRLVTTGTPTRVVRSEARVVYPYWEGQWWLEWLLAYLMVFFGVILLLLSLGARWNQLDIITKLVLLSVLIHLLLLLWLSGVEIIRSFEPRGPEPGAVQVHLVSERADAGDSAAQSPTQQQIDLSRSLAFQGHEQALTPTGPDAAVQAVERELAAAPAAARPAYRPSDRAADATLADRAEAVNLRAGVAAEADLHRESVRTEARLEAPTEARRPDQQAVAIRVVVPGSDPQAAGRPTRGPAAQAVDPSRRALPEPAGQLPSAALADAPQPPSRRADRVEAGGAAARLRSRPGEQVAVAAVPLEAVRTVAGDQRLPQAAPQQNLIAGTGGVRQLPPPTAPAASPRPRALPAEPADVADAPRLQPRPVPAAPAEARLARSARAAGSGAGQAQSAVAVVREQPSAGRSLVAQPRADLLSRARRTAPADSIRNRGLPRRSTGMTDAVAVRLDDAPGSPPAAPRRPPTAGEVGIPVTELAQVRPSAAAAAARAERPGPLTEAVRPPSRPNPGSLLSRAKPAPRQPAVAAPVPSPRRPAGARDPVALRDEPATGSGSAAAAAAAEPDVVATTLDDLARPLVAAAPPRPERSAPRLPARPAVEAPDPGTALLRGRRGLAPESAAERRVPPAPPRALVAGAVALRDEPPAEPAAAARPPAAAVGPLIRPQLARLRQQAPLTSGPPRRDAYPGGAGVISIGITPPDSFLARAGVRPGVPEVARSAPLTPYSNRFGANKLAALKKYGGSEATERAVAKGLAYLASIQNENGTWGSRRRSQRKYGEVLVGKTGLCLLAFLGAGHTPVSKTEYSDVARAAVDALLRSQRDSAHFGATTAYSHGIATYALAECFALTKEDRLRKPLERAVQWILGNQDGSRDGRNRGGWGYYSSTIRPEDGFARTSITAWQVMALESARLSGLAIPEAALDAARDFLLQNYDRRYRYFLYNREPDRLRSEWRTLPASTPAAVFCLQLLGMDPGEERLAAGLEYTLDRRPLRYRRYSDDDFVLRGAGNVYFWYYSTLACFLAGGERWERWNSALKQVLLSGQAADGSFPIIDTYAGYAGDTNRDRSYTTAMCVLSLEVYYRYFTPLLKKAH